MYALPSPQISHKALWKNKVKTRTCHNVRYPGAFLWVLFCDLHHFPVFITCYHSKKKVQCGRNTIATKR